MPILENVAEALALELLEAPNLPDARFFVGWELNPNNFLLKARRPDGLLLAVVEIHQNLLDDYGAEAVQKGTELLLAAVAKQEGIADREVQVMRNRVQREMLPESRGTRLI